MFFADFARNSDFFRSLFSRAEKGRKTKRINPCGIEPIDR
jgi:hypothetical protein